jgi:molybdenum cofactor guanylyltransferase
MTLAAVVLAGGEARRFGADKLAADLDGLTVLERALNDLPADTTMIIVGPRRDVSRLAQFVREDPPGTGPAAALVTGLRAALRSRPEAIVVLPGDTPGGSRAAMALLSELDRDDGWAVMAGDTSGREQPLQLALRPAAAAALVAAGGESGGAGQSARRLVARLRPRPRVVAVPEPDHFDIDTAEQLLAWRLQDGPDVRAILAALSDRSATGFASDRPYVIAVDGPSGAGKSTLAAALRLRLGATVIEGDDFYSTALPGLRAAELDVMSDIEAADAVIDWRRLRDEVLTPLLRRESARYRPFDWDAYDGSLGPEKRLAPAEVVVLEGVYSARPELADLADLRVLLQVPAQVRSERLTRRDDREEWTRFWERAEEHYFTSVCPPEGFDMRLVTREKSITKTPT